VAAAVIDGGLGKGYDIRVIALDKSGNLRWEKQLGGNGAELGPRLAVSGDGGILLAFGATPQWNGVPPTPEPVGQVVSLDLAGEERWQVELKPGWVYALEADTTGGCWVGSGTTASAEGFGGEDWLISRIGPAGERRWEHVFGGSEQDRPSTMLRQKQGQLIVAGFSSSPSSGNKSAKHYGMSDFWCLKLDGDGQVIWQTAYGGVGQDMPSRLAAGKDGGFVLAGRSDSNLSGNKRSRTLTPYDVWFLQIGPDEIPAPAEDLRVCVLEEYAPKRILSASGPVGTTFVLEKSDYLETWHPVSTNVFGAFDSKLELPSATERSEYYRLVAD
jgi:hypothetical protein